MPLGKYEDFKFELYNHFVFIIQYHLTMDNTKRIVGFEVVPYSIKRDRSTLLRDGKCKSPMQLANYEPLILTGAEDSGRLHFSYEV